MEVGSFVSTDELMSYGLLNPDGYRHGTVRHGAKEWARYDYQADETFHVNSVESFWFLFKRSIASTQILVALASDASETIAICGCCRYSPIRK